MKIKSPYYSPDASDSHINLTLDQVAQAIKITKDLLDKANKDIISTNTILRTDPNNTSLKAQSLDIMQNQHKYKNQLSYLRNSYVARLGL